MSVIKKKGMLAALEKPAAASATENVRIDAQAAKPTEKGVIFRMSPGDWKRIKGVALERDTTIQGLIEEALNSLLKTRGIEPIGQSRKK